MSRPKKDPVENAAGVYLQLTEEDRRLFKLWLRLHEVKQSVQSVEPIRRGPGRPKKLVGQQPSGELIVDKG